MSDVRAMLACLANDEVARVFASIVLASGPAQNISVARQEKATSMLMHSGLITAGGAGQLNVAEIRSVLSGLGREASGSESPWLDEHGRITRYPRRPAERAQFLATLGEQVIGLKERLTEAQLNTRLGELTDDIPTLRRYLVVHGVLDRTVDGSSYWAGEH